MCTTICCGIFSYELVLSFELQIINANHQTDQKKGTAIENVGKGYWQDVQLLKYKVKAITFRHYHSCVESKL